MQTIRNEFSPQFEPRMRRLQSRALASVVGDLVQHSGSSSTTAAGASYPSGNVHAAAMNRPPYMDVQTVKTNITVDQAAKLEGQSHCLLLMEPVLLPNLGHTDVGRETLPGDRPLFYPNGYKNCCLGTNVRNALFQSSTHNGSGRATGTETRQLFYGGTARNPQQAYFPQSHDSIGYRQHEPQSPPSDWAGSSAYYSFPSETSSSGCTGKAFYSDGPSDERSISAAVPAGQGGRFPTDVWGESPGGYEGGHTSKNSRCRRDFKRAGGLRGGSGGPVALRRSSSGSVDSGSIVDRRLARYAGRDGGGSGGRGDCRPPQGSLLPGRTAEIARARQQLLQYYLQQQHEQHPHHQQQQQQQQQQHHQRLPSRGKKRTSTDQRPPGSSAELSPAQNVSRETSTISRPGTYESSDDGVTAPSFSHSQQGTASTSSATTRGWTAMGTTNVGDPICDAAGRDSEWLAERRAADREAKEVLRALKDYNTRLCFLVGGGC